MEKEIKTRKERNKGVTLVALAITIIVLLILAGITINLTIGEDGIIKKAQQAGKNYVEAAENEKLLLGQFTNEMDNIISGSTNSGRVPYNSEFRKNVVEAINKAGVATTENDTDETIVTNIGKILKEATKDATATADNISEGKTAWVNGELITGNGSDNVAYMEMGATITPLYNNGIFVDDATLIGIAYYCYPSSETSYAITPTFNEKDFKISIGSGRNGGVYLNKLINFEEYTAVRFHVSANSRNSYLYGAILDDSQLKKIRYIPLYDGSTDGNIYYYLDLQGVTGYGYVYIGINGGLSKSNSANIDKIELIKINES